MAKPIDKESWILAIKAIPKASRDEVVGYESDELKVKLRAVPEDGKANKALIRFLAKQAGIPRSAIELQSGSTSRHKRLKITGVAQSSFFDSLGIALL